MYAIDFEYDGQYLSDYGFIVCQFNPPSDAVVVTAGSRITFSKVARDSGRQFSLTAAKYDECIQATFDICKNPDLYDNLDDRQITEDEYRDLMRWLNRREFLKFQALDYDEYNKSVCYYNVSFNIDKIKIAERLYGLRLTLENDRPFGYGQEQSVSLNFTDASATRILTDISDEIGYLYPDMVITCNESGDLTIHNEFEDCTMLIRNCTAGEVITINGSAQIITSSHNDHDIANDFNYEFFKIGNTFYNRNNKISVSIPCKITIKYTPIIKDAP